MKTCTIVFLLLFGFAAAAAAAAPRLLSSTPGMGAADVAVDVGEVRFVFDRDMRTTSWTFWKSDRGDLPPIETGETENPWRDARTCVLRIGRLEPGRAYAVQLNCAARGRQGFTSAEGSPLPDTVVSFTTATKAAAAPVAPVAPRPAPAVAPVKPATLDLGPARLDPTREWTVFLYLAADNDVERYSTEAMDDLEAAMPERGVTVIALWDRATGFSDTHGDFTDTRVYRLRRGSVAGKIESELLTSVGEWNLGDPASLAGFLAAGVKAFPARHHALFMWDHGSGWSGQAIDMGAPGHKGPYDELTLPEFERGLAGGLKAAGIEKLDVVLFHMCLMGQVEIAAALEPFARYMVASEAMIPCRYVPYGRLAAALPGATDARNAAERLGAVYSDVYRSGEDRVSTASVVDLSHVPALLAAIDAFAKKIAPAADRVWPALSRSLFFSLNYMGRADYRHGTQATSSIDLLDALRRMRASIPDFPAQAEVRGVEKALAACVLGRYAGAKWRLANGLAIYGPVRGDVFNPEYAKTAFARRTGWGDLLRTVHTAQKRELTPPSIPAARILGPDGKPTEEVSGLGGTHVEFAVEGKNILWTFVTQLKQVEEPAGHAIVFRTFVVDPHFDERRQATAADSIDLVMPEYADGRTVLRREVGGIVFQVTDGKRAFEATVDLSDPTDLQHARVPIIYSHPSEGTFRADLYFDVDWARVAGIVGYVKQPDGRVVPRSFTPQPDAEITFLYEVIGQDGKLALLGTGKTKWGDGPMLLPMFQEPGRYALAIDVESIGGHSATRLVSYEQKTDPQFANLDRRGGTYAARDVVGEWNVLVGQLKEGTAELEWSEVGITVRFSPTKEANVLEYAFSAKSGEDMPSGLALVDTRGAPQIVYFVKNDDGQWMRSDLHIAFLLREGQTAAIIAKDLARGSVFQYVRSGGGPAPGPDPRPAPVSGLPGVWRSADGNVVIQITADRFQTSMGGRIVSAGMYRVEGNRIVTTLPNGMVEVLVFELTGDRLVLVNQMGRRLDLTRQR